MCETCRAMRSSLWNWLRRASPAATACRQELQRHRLIEREVVGAVDLAHAAAAEQRDEPVAAGDDGAGREASGRGVTWVWPIVTARVRPGSSVTSSSGALIAHIVSLGRSARIRT